MGRELKHLGASSLKNLDTVQNLKAALGFHMATSSVSRALRSFLVLAELRVQFSEPAFVTYLYSLRALKARTGDLLLTPSPKA